MPEKKLRVWWIPQIPMHPFYVEVASVSEGVKLMRTLADYDRFQYENNVKPDYCNQGGLQQWSEDCDGDGTPGWEDWYDDEAMEDDPERWLEAQTAKEVAEAEKLGIR